MHHNNNINDDDIIDTNLEKQKQDFKNYLSKKKNITKEDIRHFKPKLTFKYKLMDFIIRLYIKILVFIKAL